MEYDQFSQIITTTGNSLCIVIPNNVARFSGLNKGDILKVLIQKQNTPREDKEIKKIQDSIFAYQFDKKGLKSVVGKGKAKDFKKMKT